MSLIYLRVCRPVAECAALVAKSLRKNTEGHAEGKSRIGWLLSGLGCRKSEGNVNGARLKAAATLRSRSAGSQDESRCSAIHRFNGNVEFLAFFSFLELG